MSYRLLIAIIALLPCIGWGQRKVLTQVPVSPPIEHSRPVEVEASLIIQEIEGVDEGQNCFILNGYLDLAWYDARLAFAPKPGAEKVRTYLERNAQEMLDKIWWPDVEFVNERGRSEAENQELMIAAEGDVLYREKVRVTLSTPYAMRQFPFDTQRLQVHLESFSNSADKLVFRVRKGIVAMSPEMRVAGWRVIRVDESVRVRQDVRDRARFSELQATITVKREPRFFVVKFFVPLVVVMLLICGVLWMPADQVKDRVSATLTGMLTSAAYGFTITNYLPAHVYNTFLDAVVLLALFHSSMLMVENVVSFRFHVTDRAATALKLDQRCRIFLPLGFLFGIVALAFRYGLV